MLLRISRILRFCQLFFHRHVIKRLAFILRPYKVLTQGGDTGAQRGIHLFASLVLVVYLSNPLL